MEKAFHDLEAEYAECTKCGLHRTRKRVVHFRGHMPCDILLIGEAPGESEDALGFPFVGKAGKRLDTMLKEAYDHAFGNMARPPDEVDIPFIGITNICCCLPKTISELSSGSIREPSKQEAIACSSRLARQIELCNPKKIVCLGRVADRFLKHVNGHLKPFFDSHPSIDSFQLTHPSAIERAWEDDPNGADLMEKRWVMRMTNILTEVSSA